jgi:hypothetical protein
MSITFKLDEYGSRIESTERRAEKDQRQTIS